MLDAVRDLETVLDADDPKFKDRQRWLYGDTGFFSKRR